MRSWIAVIFLLLVAGNSMAQEWSEKAHYDAYVKEDWKQVVKLGKLAKKSGADYYYIRARNGYAQFQLKKFRKSEKEYEKALKFNSANRDSKYYSYWASVFAGNEASALLKTTKMSSFEKDTFEVRKPKLLSGAGLLGGYRLSTSENLVGSMPYVSLFAKHEFGNRTSLTHGLSYLQQQRSAYFDVLSSDLLWQVGYLASLGIQVLEHTRIIPSFILQYWQTPGYKVYDLGATLAAKQDIGNFDVTLIGAYMQDSDSSKYIVGGSLEWYPLGNLNLYSRSSFSYVFGDGKNNPVAKQTLGGRIMKGFWLNTTITWNNELVSYEGESLGFTNNSIDRLKWRWGINPVYYPTNKLSISLTYSIESRQFWRPIGSGTAEISSKYNYHSFYVGLNYNF